MATVYGDEWTQSLITKPSTKIGIGDVNGHVRRIYFSYTVTATNTANDVIRLGYIPKGARVYDAGLKFPDMGTTGVLELGFAADVDAVETADPDAFMAGVDINAAADFVTMNQQQLASGALAGHLKKFSATCPVEIFVTTAWTASSGTIKCYIEYVQE